MNNMICRKLRSRKGKKYFYCSKQRTEIPLEEAGTVCAGLLTKGTGVVQ